MPPPRHDQQALHAQREWKRSQPSPHQGCGSAGPFLQRLIQPDFDNSRVRRGGWPISLRIDPPGSSTVSLDINHSSRHQEKNMKRGVRPSTLVPSAKSEGLLHQQDYLYHVYSLARLMAAQSMALLIIIFLRNDLMSFSPCSFCLLFMMYTLPRLLAISSHGHPLTVPPHRSNCPFLGRRPRYTVPCLLVIS